MTDEQRNFAEEHGLVGASVDDLIALLHETARSGTWPGTVPTLELPPERLPAGVTLAPFDDSDDPESDGLDRYRDLGLVAQGGMGEVRRVLDRVLDRVVVMKTLHADLLRRGSSLARFQDEARASARLQHPNIVPVYDLGVMADGRPWFTMREVKGRTLGEVIDQAHKGQEGAWTLRRQVAALVTVCQAVAYAHAGGVIHRDLKPDNIMVGALGEIYVLDWGIAKVLQAPERDEDADDGGTSAFASHTVQGSVFGTPAFMPPEQALGQAVDGRADVYALGAILYTVLTGQPPYRGLVAAQVLRQVVEGPPTPLGDREGPPLPAELIEVCERAMARDPEARLASAAELAGALEAWLDGVRRRSQAQELAERALDSVEAGRALVEQAAALRTEGQALLSALPKWAPEQDKAAGWERLRQADALDLQAQRQQVEVDQGLYAALRIASDLEVAHAALAERHRARHRAAEQARDPKALTTAEVLLERHVDALPTAHPTRVACTTYLRGDGELTLVTEPAGASVTLYRYVERNRRLVEVYERALGRTPLRRVRLAMGSYLCVLEHPDCDPVRYPVHIDRQGRWHGVPPGQSEAAPVWLPPRGTFGPDEIYVPAGWFASGGDAQGFRVHPARRLWCDGLVVQRFPVTNTQYIAFLDDLVRQGREDEALLHAPRERSSSEGVLGGLIYGRRPDGRFFRQPDADGDVWGPDDPVFQLDWHGAEAYLAWYAQRTGRPWRLPGEFEWEKAARGVDGRYFPWGDQHDPSFCCMYDSHEGRALPKPVDSYPVDVSVYGVRGMGGNVRDWCADFGGLIVDDRVMEPDPVQVAKGNQRAVRGGSWYDAARNTRSANWDRNLTGYRVSINGFRGAYRVAGL